MDNKEMREYWEELNKMYGMDLEFPNDIDFNDNSKEVRAKVVCGESIDSAMQSAF